MASVQSKLRQFVLVHMLKTRQYNVIECMACGAKRPVKVKKGLNFGPREVTKAEVARVVDNASAGLRQTLSLTSEDRTLDQEDLDMLRVIIRGSAAHRTGNHVNCAKAIKAQDFLAKKWTGTAPSDPDRVWCQALDKDTLRVRNTSRNNAV